MTITTTVKSIIDKSAIQLNDVDQDYWSESELLDYLNDGQLEIATLVGGNPKSVSTQLVAGVKQTLPADAISLIDILYNMGAAGATIGAQVNRVDLEIMRKRIPNWMTASASGVVKHFVYDTKTPLQFLVYPPQPTPAHYVELQYSAVPTKITAINSDTKITIPDHYAPALLDYVLYRACNKDSDAANQAARSQGHRQAFFQFLGVKSGNDGANSKSQ